MSIYLNTKNPLEKFKELFREKYFVDKSMIIEKMNEVLETASKYICITKPRRFGKSSVADMLGAYYSKAFDSKEIFDKLNISKSKSYKKNINKYNVINISFNETTIISKSYEKYISRIVSLLKEDILDAFPNVHIKDNYEIFDILSETNEKFIFIIDEWDYIFSHNLFEENQNDFLEFLRNLLKDKSYVALAYMTGVLPIKKYSTGSALNMFDEYTMLKDPLYSEYFGFVEEEVENLCNMQDKITIEEIKSWYNGYADEYGKEIYNPRSVVKALKNRKCQSYWTSTGAMDEVLYYLKYNIAEVRDDVIEMVSGNSIDIILDEEYRAGQKTLETKEEIYSAMVVYGFLSYYDGRLKIPNKEIMKEFEKALRDKSFGRVMDIVKNSEKMLKATLRKDVNTMKKIIDDVHNSEIPILQYNDENSLSCVVTLAYLFARNYYRIEREEKSGKGYADFLFHPRRKGDTALILELKMDSTCDKAINQIKEKKYAQKFIQENEDKRILAVAICYNSKTKEHECKVEEL
ncbi:MAG: AAA family ATPase [Clostridium sp.]